MVVLPRSYTYLQIRDFNILFAAATSQMEICQIIFQVISEEYVLCIYLRIHCKLQYTFVFLLGKQFLFRPQFFNGF